MLGKHRVPRALKDFAEIMVAEASGVIDFLAGAMAVVLLGTLEKYPWALLIYPALLSGRGAVAGVLSGNLSTMLHLGAIEASIRGNSDEYYTLISATFTTSLLVSLYAFIVSSLNALIHGVAFSPAALFFIIVVTFMSASMASVFISSSLAFLSFRKDLDPDVFTYPYSSSVNDAIISATYVAILQLWSFRIGKALVVALATLFFAIVGFLAYRSYDRFFLKVLREGLVATVIAVTISLFTGSALKAFEEELSQRPEVLFTLPALLTCMGDLGSIYSSKMTTKLHLSEIRAELGEFFSEPSVRELSLNIAGAVVISLSFGAFSVVALSVFDKLWNLILTLLLSSLIGSILIAYMGFLVAIGTFSQGWNPDNVVIPFVTSVADSFLTWLVLVISSFAYSL